MKPIPLVVIGVLGLSSCNSVPLPPEAGTVTLVPVSSEAVGVHRPKLRMKNGGLALEAYAFRQSKAETTANTHIDIVYLDASGRQVRGERTGFSPQSLPATMRLPHPHAYMLVAIQIPAGTATIEVRAHDGPHSPNSESPATNRSKAP